MAKLMWIPTKTYEALPALYLTVGALIVLGAIYIGVSHGLMPAYLSLGVSCVIAGVAVKNIRRNARCRAETGSDQTPRMVMDRTSPSSQ